MSISGAFNNYVRRPIDRYRFRHSEYRFLFDRFEGDEYISLDMETTSLDPKSADILSIGAVPVRGNEILTSRRFDVKLNAPDSMNPEAILIHKLREVDLQGQMETEQALTELLHYIGNRPILGYFIRFDIGVLNRHYKELFGFSLPNQSIELSQYYLQKVKRQHPDMEVDGRFATIAEKLQLPMLERHTAYGDALTTALMYVRLKYGPAPSV
ncbi:3'-5' exonuclease [Aestuariirhabdus sp. Z084]|uniref:3'-5' exonuclease n=1 Tax=Aestuariirhabdus haliotis TaxID=2918751 RepID=UPI00201B41F6|nr:3'-5' exonuclease [Aestuariirhabdus haliotis]MCL6417638.1 3'-5' exonuclease [Aestuariirhabdus haliotis]MCL6421564.1 3'-5' exonuclease [Aestuariirhabdus haliotis]